MPPSLLAACFAAAAVLAPGAKAPPGTLQVSRYELEVSARAGDPFLQVVASVHLRGAAGRRIYPFRLREEFVLEEIRGAMGELLFFDRRGESLTVKPREKIQTDELTWRFRYLWPQQRPLETIGGLFAQAPWYPHVEPAAGAAEPPPTPTRLSVELPRPLAAIGSGELALEEREASRRFVWTDEAGLAVVPLVIGRYGWIERSWEGFDGRVFHPVGEEDFGRRLLEFAGGAVGFFRESFGAAPRSSFALAVVPLGRGQRGRTFGGLTVLSSSEGSEDPEDSERILAHEIAHHWWGVSVEFPDVPDGWLREGLPTYSALLFLEERFGPERLRRELDNSRRIALSVEPLEPLSAGFAMSSWYAIYSQNYHKAAWVLHMLRGLFGREEFLCLLREFHETYRGQSSSALEFQWFAERRGGRDLSRFFEEWVARAEIPSLVADWSARAGQEGYAARGRILQRGAVVHMPVRLRVRLADGSVREASVDLSGLETLFEVDCSARPVALEVDPEGDLFLKEVLVRPPVIAEIIRKSRSFSLFHSANREIAGSAPG